VDGKKTAAALKNKNESFNFENKNSMKVKFFYVLLLGMGLSACQSGADPAKMEVDTAVFESEPIEGSSLQRVFRTDGDGKVLEEGFMENGSKEGTWITYYPEKGFPKTIASFVGGMYNGPYIGFNDRGNVDLRAAYKNNLLHGFWASYKFARETETREYKNGQLDGVVRKYNDRTGKLLEEVHYKDGKYDGPYRFFNDEGRITVEYIYKAGEKVSGGEILTTGQE